jgi:lysophospholipase L1-like esterase
MPETSESTSIFERNPRKTILVVLLVAFLGLDLFAAYAARLILGYPFHDRPMENHFMRDNPNKNYRTKSELYHHDLKRNAYSDSAIWGGKKYTVHTDSLGFKSDRVKNTPATADNRRILIIGDSFTEGLGVEHVDTFAGRIAAALAPQGVDVFNAGVSSYSPIIYWRKTKYLIEDVGLQFQDIVVYLDISDIEDEARFYRLNDEGTVERLERENNDTGQETAGRSGWSVKQLLKTNTLFTYFAINLARNALSGGGDSKQLSTGLARARWTLDEAIFDAYGREGLARAADNMTRLHELVSAHGVRLTLAVYPWPDQIVGNDIDSKQVSYWKEWAQARGVRFLNYFPCLVKGDGGDTVLEEYYIPGDVHWNQRGHALIADNFLRWFAEDGTENETCCCE